MNCNAIRAGSYSQQDLGRGMRHVHACAVGTIMTRTYIEAADCMVCFEPNRPQRSSELE